MDKKHMDVQAQMRAGGSSGHPAEARLLTIVVQEKPAEVGDTTSSSTRSVNLVPSLTLTVEISDVPLGGRVPEHHHGGPTIDYVLSGAVRMQL